MKLIHLSEEDDFWPEGTESVPGFGSGCFFYEMPEYEEEVNDLIEAWGGRNAFFFEIDDKYVEFVQDEGIAEYFVSADNLSKLYGIEPELKQMI